MNFLCSTSLEAFLLKPTTSFALGCSSFLDLLGSRLSNPNGSEALLSVSVRASDEVACCSAVSLPTVLLSASANSAASSLSSSTVA